MAVVLGDNRYGKAEVRMVRLTRDPADEAVRHIQDVTVTSQLSGSLDAVHLAGDNSAVTATDTQKNTVYAFAKEAPVGEIEQFGLRLARHFVSTNEAITRAELRLEQLPWARIEVDGEPTPHSFTRASAERRTATVTYEEGSAWVTAGLTELTVLNATGSEFWGFPRDAYTTLGETKDRILATAVTARWRFASTDPEAAAGFDYATSFADVRTLLLSTFATTHSLSLQQSLYAMGAAVIETHPAIAEIRLSMPNKHHFLVDLSPFGLTNDNEVFFAADRPYGLIEGSVTRDDAPAPGLAWLPF